MPRSHADDGARLSRLSLPSIGEAIDLNLTLGRRTNPGIRCAGVSLNTSALAPDEAARVIDETAQHLGLPVGDPIRGGDPFASLVEAFLA